MKTRTEEFTKGMTKKEKILGTCTLIASFLPYLLAAISLQYLPDKIPVVQLLPEAPVIMVSKYNNLVMGIFSLIPIGLVALSRFLKRKMMVDRNFGALLVSALIISLVFLAMMTFSLIKQSAGIDILYKVDIVSVLMILLSLFTAAFGAAMPYFKSNDVFGMRNRYTTKSDRVWQRVHLLGGEILTVLFLIITIPMPFIPGWWNIVLFILSCFAFQFIMFKVSKKAYIKIKREEETKAKESEVLITDI